MSLSIPTVYQYGTSKKALIEQLESQLHALDAALTAMREAGPNARDYYPQAGTAYSKAYKEHLRRVLAVEGARAEVMEILAAIIDA